MRWMSSTCLDTSINAISNGTATLLMWKFAWTGAGKTKRRDRLITRPGQIPWNPRALCSGDSAAIVVEVSGNPSWNVTYSIDGAVNSVISSTNPIVILSSLEGNYTIPYISDANGCSNIGSGTEYVDVVNKPQASIDYNPENPNMLNPQVSFI